MVKESELLMCDTKSHMSLSIHDITEVHHGIDLLFCQQYPTATCVVSNGGVRSVRDNVALDRTVRRLNRERRSTL